MDLTAAIPSHPCRCLPPTPAFYDQVALGAVIGLSFAELWSQAIAPLLLAPVFSSLCGSWLGEALCLRDSTGMSNPLG